MCYYFMFFVLVYMSFAFLLFRNSASCRYPHVQNCGNAKQAGFALAGAPLSSGCFSPCL